MRELISISNFKKKFKVQARDECSNILPTSSKGREKHSPPSQGLKENGVREELAGIHTTLFEKGIGSNVKSTSGQGAVRVEPVQY